MKQMAELLRSGATMLSHSCPECGSPLFRLKTGEIWCAKCQRRVVIVSEGEEIPAETGLKLESLEGALVKKLVTMGEWIEKENEPHKLKDIAEVIDILLVALEKLRKLRKI